MDAAIKTRFNMYLVTVILIVIASAGLVHCEFGNEFTPISCVSQTTCHDCIQTKICSWCMAPNFGDKPRCFELNPNQSDYCPEEYVWYPDAEEIILIGEPLTRNAASHATGQSVVKIYPQRVKLQLKINEQHNLNIHYSQAEDYPIDVYYLVDLSNSMDGYNAKLTKLGDNLSAKLQRITSKFRLGFGTYVSSVPKNLEEHIPYGFKNEMPLSNDIHGFSEKLRQIVHRNLNASQVGSDAIMQAIACDKKIGWRAEARRFLVFATDTNFHSAEEMKLEAVNTPNDGECHLNDNGEYMRSSTVKFPTISQINQKVLENQIHVIFAATAQHSHVYMQLSNLIEGSSSGILLDDSSNVVELIKEGYSKISSMLEMHDNSTDTIQITYYSSCLSFGEPSPTFTCSGLRVGDVFSFTVKIVVTECPQNPTDWNQIIEIYPVGINESLIVDLTMLCNCPCENVGHPLFEPQSPKCAGNGNLVCGLCECNELHFGSAKHGELQSTCRSNDTTMLDCSGRGLCVCGTCECNLRGNPDELVYGKYCECDNYTCDRFNGLICGGDEHGTCECGRCICKPGWTGYDCMCHTSNDTCMPPNGDEICSGHGVCHCGSCKCQGTSDGRYRGKFCEK